MGQLFEAKEIDRETYEEKLKSILPDKLIDIHSHIWLERLKKNVDRSRVVSWPPLVVRENTIEDHLECYRLMFPGKRSASNR